MIVEVKVPSPGESVSEVEVGSWLVADGEVVWKDQEIAEVESDKATLTIVSPESGQVKISAGTGESIAVGTVICTIDTDVMPQEEAQKVEAVDKKTGRKPTNETGNPESSVSEENEADRFVKGSKEDGEEPAEQDRIKITPVARELMREQGVSVGEIIKGLKRLGKKEVEVALDALSKISSSTTGENPGYKREEERKTVSPLRKKLAERMVAVKNETAMLTTFNEVDMGYLMELRKKYQQQFTEKYGFKLGFMSFFAKAVAIAMEFHPIVNARFDQNDIIIPRYVDVGIAVSTPKGLMVPVVRNVESKTIPKIELEIKELAEKARNKKISVNELSGGSFTITNGGVFGSLLSTPIINPPQSAILGMHNITDRPIARNGQVVVRPMMYVALSYDHRMIDGKDSVGFLVRMKELIENPLRLMSGGVEPEQLLLGI